MFKLKSVSVSLSVSVSVSVIVRAYSSSLFQAYLWRLISVVRKWCRGSSDQLAQKYCFNSVPRKEVCTAWT